MFLYTCSLSPINGFYNPSTGKGHGEEVGVRILDDVEVLVLLLMDYDRTLDLFQIYILHLITVIAIITPL